MSKRIAFILIAIVGLCSAARPSGAWMCIAHYTMGRELGYSPEVAGMMNLPDAWKNTNWIYQITDIFTWSHATQRTGGPEGVARSDTLVKMVTVPTNSVRRGGTRRTAN